MADWISVHYNRLKRVVALKCICNTEDCLRVNHIVRDVKMLQSVVTD